MKWIKTLLFSLSILAISTTVTANNRYINFDGQGVWTSNSSTPAVRVYIKGSYLYAQAKNRKLKLPATKLKRVNGNLLNEYTHEYIRIQDFNHDKFADIGILKSVGYGGSNRCYAVFEYLPKFYSYKARSKKTVCID